MTWNFLKLPALGSAWNHLKSPEKGPSKLPEIACLSGPILRDLSILSLRYPISRDTFQGRSALPRISAILPPWHFVSRRHICAIPHFATYRAISVRYPIKQTWNSFAIVSLQVSRDIKSIAAGPLSCLQWKGHDSFCGSANVLEAPKTPKQLQ